MVQRLTHKNAIIGSTVIGLLAAAALGGGTVTIDLVAYEGLVPEGGDKSAITSVNAPFTNANGQVGFTAVLGSGDRLIWFDDGPIWLNTDALPDFTITGAEGTMGISNNGGFIYGPSVDGDDAVWTHHGLLLAGTQPAPGVKDLFATFNSRPRMTPDGTAYWIAGFSDSAGGSTQGRIWYLCADPSDPASSVPILTTQEEFSVDGEIFTPTNTGIGFAHEISHNAEHRIVPLTLAGLPSASNEFIWLNGNLVLREGASASDGTTWNSFSSVSINNDGDWVLSGNTIGGPPENAEFLAHNGQVVIRRGDVLDGITLESNWVVRWASINNLGHVAHIWEGGFGSSLAGTLFVTLDPKNPTASTIALVSIGEGVDTTDDGMPDAVVADFNASTGISPGIDFSDHPWVYVEVDLQDILAGAGELGPEYEAIIGVPLPGSPQPCPEDLNGDNQVNVFDLLIVLADWGNCPGCDTDLNGDDLVNVFDLLVVLAAWGQCD